MEISTRELSGEYLKKLLPKNPQMIGGAADVGDSTNTRIPGFPFIEYGVREHAMGAIMNGMAAAGLRPFGGTFLAFSDYMRGAIRMAAISKLPTIFVFTHDSIAVGADGPTHQPVEQIASLRLIPNLNVFRPCNAAEVKWAWDTAMSETDRPSCIILSRQKFEQIETHGAVSGGYIIHKSKNAKITLIATGSEVPLAVAVAKKLGNASVVSMPSVSHFREFGDKKILSGRVIAIEAGATAGWFEFADAVVGIDTFGANGDGAAVYKHFGFDADAIAREIMKK